MFFVRRLEGFFEANGSRRGELRG